MSCFGNKSQQLRDSNHKIDELETQIKLMKEVDVQKTNQLMRAWAEIHNRKEQYETLLAQYETLQREIDQLHADLQSSQTNITRLMDSKKYHQSRAHRIKKEKAALESQLNGSRLSTVLTNTNDELTLSSDSSSE